MSDKPNLVNAIFNSDDYKRGSEDGYKDGLAGKDRSFYKMPLSLKVAIHGDAAMDSYASGYRHGYTLGASVRLYDGEHPQRVEQTTTTQRGMAMPGFRGIDGQIDLLNTMEEGLKNLSATLEELIKMQENILRELDEEGLDNHILRRLEEYRQSKADKFKTLLQIIDEEELPYVVGIIQHLLNAPR